MNAFAKWLDTFLSEKGIDLDDTFTIETDANTHIFDYAAVAGAMKTTGAREQAAIKTMIVKIDFRNGDVRHYMRHLARALAERADAAGDGVI
ncbi:MAG: hypothetical protein EKK55_07015 [Rhodocyclaceae bacterium]|nr:MAG: hypothetical protein EKK55_07015 [Rhodocyclaceae bacterium]